MERLETVIATARNCLQETLAQRLMNVEQQRLDLFIISGEEQIARLASVFLKSILT